MSIPQVGGEGTKRFPFLLSTAVMLAVTVLSAMPAQAGFLNIGTVETFQTSSSGTNPTGTWTLEDKDFIYINSSGWSPNTSPIEDLQLTTNLDPSLFTNQFLIDNLSAYSSPITLKLGYQVHINGFFPENWDFRDVQLGVIGSGNTFEVWKDVYASRADFDANTTAGSGTLAAIYDINGVVTPPSGPVLFPHGLTDLWVRATIQLSAPGGGISSIGNTFRQEVQVPEVDPGFFGSALALVMGSLGLVERRVRRVAKACIIQ
jgi:hypothetical protein